MGNIHQIKVKILVISGDNPLTVSAIARKAGVQGAQKYINLSEVKDKDIPKIVDKYVVFGRVTPSQKQLLVKALKEKGHTVAMTGDGVNDILALKEADCSIAMANGADAARSASHLVLLDSKLKFSTITNSFPCNLEVKALLRANLLSFLFCFLSYFLGFGPKTIPPPGH